MTLKILIEIPTWVGDCVMITPSIRNIIKTFKKVDITIIGSAQSLPILEDIPEVSKTIVLNKNFLEDFFVFKGLKEYDYFFSYRSSLRTRILKLFIDANYKYQFDKRKYFLGHQVEKYNNFINDALSTNNIPSKLFLYSSGVSKILSNSLKIGINPGAAYGSAKMWTIRGFSELIKELSKEYTIVIFGAGSNIFNSRKILKGIDNKNIIDLTGKTTIKDLVLEISKLDIFITGDSGPMHIAAAFNIPTISLFGPTKFKETSQWKNKHSVLISKDLDCQPCMKRECPLGHHNCMKLIESREVIDCAKKLIREIQVD